MMPGHDEEWSAEKRELFAASFWSRGMLRIHDAGGPEVFQQKWTWPMFLIACIAAILTGWLVSRLFSGSILRYPLGILVGFCSIPVWQAVVGGTILVLHGFGRIDKDEPES